MRSLWVAALAVMLTACKSASPDPFAHAPYVDAGVDASDASRDAIAEAGPDADGLGAPCTDDGQCDDELACTFDACDTAQYRCRNVPDDSLCDDGVYCNGKE